jgi:hypothetical protein
MRNLLCLFSFLLCGCASLQAKNEPVMLPRDTQNLVTSHQATEIADAYFLKYISGCGGILDPTLKNSQWLFPYEVGFAAVPGNHPIVVSASTGAVRTSGFPTVSDPIPLLKSVRQEMSASHH